MQKFIMAQEHTQSSGFSGVRFFSGRQVLDEALIDGRYICRYRNCNGQIYPEMRVGKNMYQQAAGDLQLQSFSVAIDGKRYDIFEYEGFFEVPDESGLRGEAKVFAVWLVDPEKKVRVRVMTRLDGSDFIVRWLEVENLTNQPFPIDYINPLSGRIFDLYENGAFSLSEAIEAGRMPFEIAYNHLTDWRHEGDFYFEPLQEGLLNFSGMRGKSGFNRPAFWLRNLANGETFVCEFGYSGNWNAIMSYNKHTFQSKTQKQHQLCAEIGITAPQGEAAKIVYPGQTQATPMVHLGVFRDPDETIVQALHQHVRDTIILELPQGVPIMELEANHRGYLSDCESHEGILNDVDVAKSCGVEMYVIDAGWYGNPPNTWYDNVGDWTPAPWLSQGIRPIADYVHGKGMRFGLWAEFEAAGTKSTLRQEHPEFLLRRNGKLAVAGRALDLANPVVEEYLTNEICRMIEEYDLDMFRIDHNHDVGLGGTREEAGYLLNTCWNYYEAFARIFKTVHKRHPEVMLQNCASGGGRLDFETLRYFHNTELTDWLRAPRTLRIFSGTMMALPPEILLRTYGTEVEDLPMDTDLDAQLRSIMISRPIFRGIAPDLATLTPYLRQKLEDSVRLFKEFMRPMMKDCKVYHHTPYLPIMEPCPWMVLEYTGADQMRGMAAVFSLCAQTEPGNEEYYFKAKGLDLGSSYRVTFLNTNHQVVLSGQTLMLDGIFVRVGRQMSSEMLLFEAVTD